jgi:hypothetical protein
MSANHRMIEVYAHRLFAARDRTHGACAVVVVVRAVMG